MNSILSTVLFSIFLICTQFTFGQNREEKLTYPRIEIYTEKDYADQFTGSDQTTDVLGRTVYMGKRLSDPYINRTSYLIPSELVEKLMSKSLEFLPYFKEIKEATSLKRYFELDAAKHLPDYKKQFPFHIEGYKSHEKDERIYFQTIIEYQLKQPNRVEVIWLSEDQWYVNDVFYTIDLSEFQLEENKIVEEKLVRSRMVDFIRFSNIIQPKLGEGTNYLRMPTELFELDPSRIILIVSLSPGSPGTHSFEYTLEGNGKLSSISRNTTREKLNHLEVVSIMNQINQINFEAYSVLEKPVPFVHDGQTSTVRAFYDGILKTVSASSGGDPMPKQVADFSQKMVDFFAGKIPVESNVIARRQIVAPQTFAYNQGKDSIVFEQMYDSLIESDNSSRCQYAELEIKDSIDLNKDGVKELIFLRQCNCSTTPEVSLGEMLSSSGILIGAKQYSYGSFEVWDIATKKMIFNVPFQSEVQITTSTSCIANNGYSFNVELTKNGEFILSNMHTQLSGYSGDLVEGRYRFVKGKYELK